MIGIIVSGSAVPTAASTDPTAPSASSSLRPNHSMPLVNSSAPIRMTTKARTRTRTSMRQTVAAPARRDADRDDRQDRDRDRDHQPVAGPGVARRAATITRLIGVAMTASRPSHRKPGRLRARATSGTSRPGSSPGRRTSGEMPGGQQQRDADDEQRRPRRR